jgi:phosphoglycolate phosphatase-like HAD superfamily hydrolase
MKTIWFDFDGTLVTVKHRYQAVHETICRSLGVHPLPEETYWQMRCIGISTRLILEKVGASEKFDDYISLRNKLIESKEFLDLDEKRTGADEVLTELHKKFKLCILSGRASNTMLRQQLTHLHLADFFSEVYTVNPFDNWNAKFEVLKQHASGDDLIIGDSARDLKAGKARGIRTTAILSGMSSPELLRLEDPDSTIAELTELPALLR